LCKDKTTTNTTPSLFAYLFSILERLHSYIFDQRPISLFSQVLDPLPSLIVKLELTDAEVLECKKAIFHVVGIESRNEALPNSAAGFRGKGAKRYVNHSS